MSKHKYIDADLLRKEIEFAKTVYEHPNRVVHGVADAFRQDGRAAMCDDILKKLDSLEQEQQEVELEEEINRFWDSCIKHKNERGGNVIWSNKLEVEVLARHFYELGLNARKEE